MELEFFCKPNTDLEWFAFWKKYCLDFLNSLGLDGENLRYRDHEKKNFHFIVKQQLILNINIQMDGENFGE